MKVATVVGARPQFIKAAVFSNALTAALVEEVLVHTGQHYDANMSEVFFRELGLAEPRYNLGVGSGSHGHQTGAMLSGLEDVLRLEKPDVTVVFGDTNSTLAGALASAKLHIPVAHVEAGLRSFNRKMPEEINRILTDHASTLLFAPTLTAVGNLRAEGLSERTHLVGDVMYDAAIYAATRAKWPPEGMLQLPRSSSPFVVATLHREENTDSPHAIRVVMTALREISRLVPVVCPLHPRTRERLGDLASYPGITFLDPLSFLEMSSLVLHSSVVVTDSGGLQKEAFFHRKPCVTLRSETEWVELVQSGWNRLVDPRSVPDIVETVVAALGGSWSLNGLVPPPFGDGHACEAVVRILCEQLA